MINNFFLLKPCSALPRVNNPIIDLIKDSFSSLRDINGICYRITKNRSIQPFVRCDQNLCSCRCCIPKTSGISYIARIPPVPGFIDPFASGSIKLKSQRKLSRVPVNIWVDILIGVFIDLPGCECLAQDV